MNVRRTAHIASDARGHAGAAAADGRPDDANVFGDGYRKHEVVELVGTTRRITRADIDARNARTLDEALRLLPGVYVRTGGDGTPRIDVRGFRSRHVLLLINGVQVNSTADGQFDPARISTKAIREIKVSYGSSSVLYGDNAMAGVIEITTVDDKPEASLEVSGGTPDQKGVGGRYSGTMGEVVVHRHRDGLRHRRVPSSGFLHPDATREWRPP